MSERPQSRFPLVPLLLAVAVGMATVACDSGGDNDAAPDVQNEFSFDVTTVSASGEAVTADEHETTLNGFSFFYEGTAPDTDEELFVVYFTEGDVLNEASSSEGLFGFVAREGLRPQSGTYPFVSFESGGDVQSEFGMILFENVGNVGTEGGSLSWYIVDGGTIDLTTASDERVEGTISAEAINLTIDGTTSDSTRVTIDGTFTARTAESFVGFTP
jgi:hypothetical protein